MGGHLLVGPAALREGRVLVATKAMPPPHKIRVHAERLETHPAPGPGPSLDLDIVNPHMHGPRHRPHLDRDLGPYPDLDHRSSIA